MPDPVPSPAGLEVGGEALWLAATTLKVMHPGELVVLEEACRIKDRLDLFAALLSGSEDLWCRVRNFADGAPSVLMIDSAVTEARLHAGELRQLVEKLRLPLVMVGDADGQGTPEVPKDDVAARRAEREARRRSAGATGS